MKLLSVGAEFFHAERRPDGQTDRYDKTNSRALQTLRTRLKVLSHG
jgi:hypothetical protein